MIFAVGVAGDSRAVMVKRNRGKLSHVDGLAQKIL